MKTFMLASCIALLGACAAPKPEVKVVEIKGPEVVDGPCHLTGLVVVFLQPGSSQPREIRPLPPGCRCSVTIDGEEYVKTDVERTLDKCLEEMKKQTNGDVRL